MTTEIRVRFTEPGWHNWPEAPERRVYLRDRHRHLFFVEIAMTVEHHDREVEFHDLLEAARDRWPGPELGRQSCEDIATGYIDWLTAEYLGRGVRVEVWEDNEVGAAVATPVSEGVVLDD